MKSFILQVSLTACILLSACQCAFCQYANRYSQSNSASPANYELNKSSPSKRSGYAHSASALGMLSSQGYDDLTEYPLRSASNGSYRKPQSMLKWTRNSAIISTLNTGEFYRFDFATLSATRIYSSPHRRWSRMIKLDEQTLAAIDLASDSIVVFQASENSIQQIATLSASGNPHSLAWDAESATLFVSGQWSQRLYRFRADSGLSTWQSMEAIDLPIHGGAICVLPKQQSAVIADAFSGNYVVLAAPTTPAAKIVHQSNLVGHNVPSLQARDDEQWIVFPFQLLNPETYSVQGDITWGGLLSNNIRWLKTERMLTLGEDEVIKQGKFLPIGQVGNGGGDPNSLQFDSQNRFAVTLGGIDRVAVGRADQTKLQQFATGLHPIASLFDTTANRLFVLNEFSDSISIVDLENETTTDVPLGPMRELTLAERGERLFFHSSLAHDGWMSCHSCHSRGHTSGQLNDNTSDGSLGSPKRILSLLGQAETAPYSWSGEIPNLEMQVLNSVQSTMATDFQISRQTVDAIAAYVRTLPAPPSLAKGSKRMKAMHRFKWKAENCSSSYL
ncbi:MAG: cytochrome c peroxidase [Pirellulales bacterium]